MIDEYRNLKTIAIIDGKFYKSKDILAINESTDHIELTTEKDYVIIPKSAISRIEYHNNGVGGVNGTRNR